MRLNFFERTEEKIASRIDPGERSEIGILIKISCSKFPDHLLQYPISNNQIQLQFPISNDNDDYEKGRKDISSICLLKPNCLLSL
jgi:hypothetical protein